MTACGCVTVPDALIQLPGETRAHCGLHGYQKIVRAYSLREALGLPDPAMLPDEPPFLSAIPT